MATLAGTQPCRAAARRNHDDDEVVVWRIASRPLAIDCSITLPGASLLTGDEYALRLQISQSVFEHPPEGFVPYSDNFQVAVPCWER